MFRNSLLVMRSLKTVSNYRTTSATKITNIRKVFHSTDAKKNLSDIIKEKIYLFNNQYENLIGIAEVRQIQNKVLEEEDDFVAKTKKRISCQDELDRLKEGIKNLREKLETLPRSSDSYLNLITTEHQLLRDQISVEAQLAKLKEEEQLSFNAFSKSLRHSHQLERLSQDRTKYWQMVIAVVTLLGYTVMYKFNRSRSEKKEIVMLIEQYDTISQRLNEINSKLNNLENANEMPEKSDVEATKASRSWSSYIPDLTTFILWWYPTQ